jgi:hypothetical protein
MQAAVKSRPIIIDELSKNMTEHTTKCAET